MNGVLIAEVVGCDKTVDLDYSLMQEKGNQQMIQMKQPILSKQFKK
jgi:hypothetical protein